MNAVFQCFSVLEMHHFSLTDACDFHCVTGHRLFTCMCCSTTIIIIFLVSMWTFWEYRRVFACKCEPHIHKYMTWHVTPGVAAPLLTYRKYIVISIHHQRPTMVILITHSRPQAGTLFRFLDSAVVANVKKGIDYSVSQRELFDSPLHHVPS